MLPLLPFRPAPVHTAHIGTARRSTVAAMLQVVIYQTRQRPLLPAVPLGLLFPGNRAQTGQVPPSRAHLKQLKFEPLMLYTA